MRKINKIIIHCTDSLWGSVKEITRWHKERGFYTIGYHYVIYNGFLTYKQLKDGGRNLNFDGEIAPGRDVNEIGAHCKGQNKDSIGISLVGIDKFTENQLKNLRRFCIELIEKYNLTVDDIYGHYEFDPHKTCPNMDMMSLRSLLRSYKKLKDLQNKRIK